MVLHLMAHKIPDHFLANEHFRAFLHTHWSSQLVLEAYEVKKVSLH